MQESWFGHVNLRIQWKSTNMQLVYSISMFLSTGKCVRWDGSVSCSWNHFRISHHTSSFLQTSCGCCKTHTFICRVEYRSVVINEEISKLELTSIWTRREAWIAEVTLKHNTHDEHDGKTRLFLRLLILLLQKWDSSLCRCGVENQDLSRHSAYIRRLTLWPWSWTFTVQHTIYVKCEYFMNQEG